MTALRTIGIADTVAIIGAGTMGAGIAQVAALAGHPVLLFDAAPGAAERAVAAIHERLTALQRRGRLDRDPSSLSLTAVDLITELSPARLVIEAVVEDLDVKRTLFAHLERIVAQDCILATNTSSLSPTAIAAGLAQPDRLAGLHFFNPVPVMRLVEVVAGLQTADSVVTAISDLLKIWGKTVVRAAPTAGFIVNRVARPFYAEAWRLYEEQAADPATIDAVLTGSAGFRMGPFALMDLIGHDVNEAVTRTVWTALGNDPRFAPSIAQRALVEAGWLGRKTGRGIYNPADAHPPAASPVGPRQAPAKVIDHGAEALRELLHRSGIAVLKGEPETGAVQLPSGALLIRATGRTATDLATAHGTPVILLDRTLDDTTATAVAVAKSANCPQAEVDEATGLLQAAGLDVYHLADVPGLIVARTVAMLVNVAVDALHRGVADAADIDTAMRLGTNYPVGPLEWGDRWGPAVILQILDELLLAEGDPHYRASTLLRRHATSGASLT